MNFEEAKNILIATKSLYLQPNPADLLCDKRKEAIQIVSSSNNKELPENASIYDKFDLFIENSINNGILTQDEINSYTSESDKYLDIAKKLAFNAKILSNESNMSIFDEFVQLVELGNTDKQLILSLLSK